jgi:hypothetical protein
MKKILLFSAVLLSITAAAQEERHNFYITGKDKGFHFSSSTVKSQAWIQDMLDKKFHFLVAGSDEEAVKKMIAILEACHGKIGTLWFDSHGLYKQGYSSFHIGNQEFSYKNIRDSNTTHWLQALSAFCDNHTDIGVGSCYGGATFHFPGNENAPAGRMNGDSLMIGMGKLFPLSNIYASESWVMNKPGIFANNFAFAGYPLGKKYKKPVWTPVWSYVGRWKKFNYASNKMEDVNTVALDKNGRINVRLRDYQELEKAQRKLNRHVKKLES